MEPNKMPPSAFPSPHPSPNVYVSPNQPQQKPPYIKIMAAFIVLLTLIPASFYLYKHKAELSKLGLSQVSLPFLSKPKPSAAPPVEKVDKANKSGEFVITQPAQDLSQMKTVKQFLIEGSYNIQNNTLSANTSLIDSPNQDASPPFIDLPNNIPLEIIISNNKKEILYSTLITLTPIPNRDAIAFAIQTPYYKDVTLTISHKQTKKLLYSANINL